MEIGPFDDEGVLIPLSEIELGATVYVRIGGVLVPVSVSSLNPLVLASDAPSPA